MRTCTFGIAGVLLSVSLAAQPANPVAAERVVVPSARLQLAGLLWRPAASTPFPAVLFNHGGRTNDLSGADVLGPIFVKHGYAFLYLFRRGYGPSANQAEYMWDILDREEKARGADARRRLQFTFLTTDHLDDAMAGLAFLKRLPGVDARRLAVGGHSFGGILALLAVERDTDVRAAVTFGAAAQQWDGSPDLQQRLLAAARNIERPIFMTHAANDYSTVPGQMVSAERTRFKRPHELKIYPAVGTSPREGHQAAYTDVATWEPDVFRFLDTHLRPPSHSASQRRETVQAGPASLQASGPVTVVGHAFGTRVARTLAADRPDLVKQLILMAPAGAVRRSAATEAITTRFFETPLGPADRLAAIRQVFFCARQRPSRLGRRLALRRRTGSTRERRQNRAEGLVGRRFCANARSPGN